MSSLDTFLKINIALFDAYIRKKLKEEPSIQLKQLCQEIKQKGYNGSLSTVYEYFLQYVRRTPQPRVPRLPDIFYVLSKTSFLLLRKQKQLTKGELKLIGVLCKQRPEIKIASQLATRFKAMMEQRRGSLIYQWIQKAIAL